MVGLSMDISTTVNGQFSTFSDRRLLPKHLHRVDHPRLYELSSNLPPACSTVMMTSAQILFFWVHFSRNATTVIAD